MANEILKYSAMALIALLVIGLLVSLVGITVPMWSMILTGIIALLIVVAGIVKKFDMKETLSVMLMVAGFLMLIASAFAGIGAAFTTMGLGLVGSQVILPFLMGGGLGLLLIGGIALILKIFKK